MADEAVLELGEQKWNHYAHVCKLLGARCVEVESLQVENIKFRESLFVRFVSLFPLASVGREKEQFQETIKKRCDRREYPGLERPDMEAVEEYIRRNWLEDHEDIKDLKESRTGPNPLQNCELSVEVSHHIESNLKLVKSLYLPSYLTEINAQVEKTCKQMFQTKLDVTLQFL